MEVKKFTIVAGILLIGFLLIFYLLNYSTITVYSYESVLYEDEIYQRQNYEAEIDIGNSETFNLKSGDKITLTINEKDYEFAIRANVEGDCFAQRAIFPQRESWCILKKPNSVAVIPLSSVSKPPFIVSGRLDNNEPVKCYPLITLDTREHFLHYVWPLEFHDLDGKVQCGSWK